MAENFYIIENERQTDTGKSKFIYHKENSHNIIKI